MASSQSVNMRFGFVTVVTLSRLLAAVSAQQAAQAWAGTDLLSYTGAISPCAVYCVVTALTNDGCDPNDFVCHCANTGRVDEILFPCLTNSTCSPTDIASSAMAAGSACAYFNGTSDGTLASASPTPTTLIGAAATAATIRNTVTRTVIPSASSGGVPTATQELLLSFGTGTGLVSPGALLGINVPTGTPQIGLNYVPVNNQRVEPGSAASIYTPPNVEVFGPHLYIVIAVDPDAPEPANPIRSQIIHWIQPNMRLINASTLSASTTDFIPYIFFANETSTPPIIPYRRPMPPNYSPAHRYIFYAFEQGLNFNLPAGFNASNRFNFNVSRFAADAGLGSPIAANYILVSNQTGAIAPNATATTVPSGGMSGGTASTTASGVAVYTGAAVSIAQSGWTVAAFFGSALFAMGL